jgi:hypothetical protein
VKLLPKQIALLQLLAFIGLVYCGSFFRPLLLASPVLQPSLQEYQFLQLGVWLSTAAIIALILCAGYLSARAPVARITANRLVGASLVVGTIAALLLFWLWLTHGTYW